MPLFDKNGPLIVALLYIHGVILGAFTFLPSWALRGSWPEWSWWEYLVAPLVLGVVALLFEWAFEPIRKWLEWGNKNAPQWKRTASFFLVFFGGVALIAMSMFIQQWWEG